MIHTITLDAPSTVALPASSTRYVPLTVSVLDATGKNTVAPGNKVYVRALNPASGAVVPSILTTRGGSALSASAVSFAPVGDGWLAVSQGLNGIFPLALALAYNQALPAIDVECLVGSSTQTRIRLQTIRFETASVATTLGTPAGASLSADIAAIKAVVDAIKLKTDTIP